MYSRVEIFNNFLKSNFIDVHIIPPFASSSIFISSLASSKASHRCDWLVISDISIGYSKSRLVKLYGYDNCIYVKQNCLWVCPTTLSGRFKSTIVEVKVVSST